jgi:O-methyltransferase
MFFKRRDVQRGADAEAKLDVNQLRDRGGDLLRRGEVEAGLACFREVMRINPRHRIALSELIRFLLEHGRDEEARRWVKGTDFAIYDEMCPARHHDFTPAERLRFAEVGSLIAGTPAAAAALGRSVEYLVRNRIPGVLVECGVYQGGSIVVMLRTLIELGVTDREVYLFDTFEGMSEPEEVDVMWHGERGVDVWPERKREGTKGSDWVYCPIETVRHNVERTGYPKHRLHFVKGMVEETLPAGAPDQIAMLRLDTDFHASTKHELIHLYPRLVKGGVLIIDDYGAYQGARIATDEYIRENNIPILLNRIDEHVRCGVKP